MAEIVFIDVEATGLDTEKSRIIEIGFLKCRILNNGYEFEEIDSISVLVNPGFQIDETIQEITGITNEDLNEAPGFEEIAADLFLFFKYTSYISGHNILRFDIPILSSEFNRSGFIFPIDGMKYVDTYSIFAGKEKRDLSAALKFYHGIEKETSHRALSDSKDSQLVFSGQMTQYDEFGSLEDAAKFSMDGMVDFAGKFKYSESGEIIFNFSKHIGKPAISEIGMLKWMIDSEFPSDTKKWCKKIINGEN